MREIMKNQNRCLAPNFGASLLLSIAALAWLQPARLPAQSYQVVIFEPPAGFVETRVEGVRGTQRVGAARVADGVYPEYTHAFLWNGNSPAPIDLHPPNWTYSKANATDGTSQVGYVEGQNPPYSNRHAALWNGTPENVVYLWPLSDWGLSEALSIGGNQQVGFVDRSFGGNAGGITYRIHALLWAGTPESVVDLHPTSLPGANAPGDQRSWAVDTDGVSQVGHADLIIPLGGGSYRSEIHALLWQGTAASVVDLHPTGWDWSYAIGVKNGSQAGYGVQDLDSSPVTALVWHGSASSLRILGEGTINDTNGPTHVGSIGVNNASHAFRWDGDSGSGFDLHPLLPPGFSGSGATDIDDAGNIVGWAQTESGYLVGVSWSVSTPNAAPTVALTNPTANGSYQANTVILLTVSAQDNDGSVTSVEYFVNGGSLGIISGGQGPGAFPKKWAPPAAGSYRIEAKATDDGGASTMSIPITIGVAKGPRQVR
jgi:hypothetical protein